MYKHIEQVINDYESGNVIKLDGEAIIDVYANKSFTVGNLPVKGLINVKRGNIVIDGSNAVLNFNIYDVETSDWALFYLSENIEDVEFKNMKININIINRNNSSRIFACIYNLSYALKINNCNINMYSSTQLSLIGIYNNGTANVNKNYKADNLVINNNKGISLKYMHK